jgi:tetratricopeptide (TPR) repeat protein
MNIGDIHYVKGELEQAMEYYQQSFDIWKERNDPYGMTFIIEALFLLSLDQKNYPEAEKHLDDLHDFSNQIFDRGFSTKKGNMGLGTSKIT